jgi:cell division septation protein DedD
MKNLVRHIDFLLRDNDCVILPGFGGFIAHAVPAYYIKEEHTYYPPSRSISFNAAITMNDGLLAQSYMKSYGVDYARATYMIDMAIDQLRDTLDDEGEATLPHIGVLKQDIYQSLQFIPETAGIASSNHFGLGTFSIQELSQLCQPISETSRKPETVITHTEKTIDLHINKSALRQVVYTAAVFLLLLMVSMPIGNEKITDIAAIHFVDAVAPTATTNEHVYTEPSTDVDMNNTDVVYEEHEDCLLPSTEVAADEMIVTDTTSTSNTIEVAAIPSAEMPTMEMPVTLETETAIEPEEPKEVAEIVTEPTPTISKTYHIIVASLPSLRGANETLDEYVSKGYTDASLVERDNRVRISIKQFTDKDEANSYLKSLREEDTFKNAWLLAVRN